MGFTANVEVEGFWRNDPSRDRMVWGEILACLDCNLAVSGGGASFTLPRS
jgi:hypothetical protein